MNLLGPAPGENPLDENTETSGSGIIKLLIFGAVGFGVLKLFSSRSEEELDGY